MEHEITTDKGRLEYYKKELKLMEGRRSQYLTDKTYNDIISYYKKQIRALDRGKQSMPLLNTGLCRSNIKVWRKRDPKEILALIQHKKD